MAEDSPVRVRSPAHAATASALLALGLWSLLAALAQHLRGLPPFLLVGIALLIGGAVGLVAGVERGTSWRAVLLGVYGFFAYPSAFSSGCV